MYFIFADTRQTVKVYIKHRPKLRRSWALQSLQICQELCSPFWNLKLSSKYPMQGQPNHILEPKMLYYTKHLWWKWVLWSLKSDCCRFYDFCYPTPKDTCKHYFRWQMVVYMSEKNLITFIRLIRMSVNKHGSIWSLRF